MPNNVAIKLIVGLGNPGSAYADTRHNAGRWFVEHLAASHGQNFKLEKNFNGHLCRLSQGCLLLLPTSFMNCSGQSVQAVSHYYKIEPEAILVAHDELDLPVGNIKLKQNGGHGGHNGLRDTIASLSSKDFLRLRVGIGHPGHRDAVHDHVLSNPSKVDRLAILSAIDRALTISPLIMDGDIKGAMHQLHS